MLFLFIICNDLEQEEKRLFKFDNYFTLFLEHDSY